MPNIAPTKGNLISAKRELALAKLGYELMDRKRTVLIREMMSLIKKAKDIQTEIDRVFSCAYEALKEANIRGGSCEDIALAAPIDNSLKLGHRSVMGVEIPIISGEDISPRMTYGFLKTSSSLDSAIIEFYNVKNLTLNLSEIEISVYRLAYAIKKAKKRANALENIIIPQLIARIDFISGALEEKEREEFARLKVIKAKRAN